MTPLSPILSPAEDNFHRSLIAARPKHLNVMPKVRLRDLIGEMPFGSTDFKEWHNGACMRHADFILTDQNHHVVLIIELDDQTHKTIKSQRSDNFKNSFAFAHGIRILHITTQQNYNTNQLQSIIFEALKAPPQSATLNPDLRRKTRKQRTTTTPLLPIAVIIIVAIYLYLRHHAH